MCTDITWRYFSSTPPSSDSDTDNNRNSTSPNVIFYKAPMADLISRLKIISITTCVISVGVLPAVVALKNGALPTLQQTTMGGVALLGATGSTLALDFVFGPYVLDMKWIQQDISSEADDEAKTENNDITTSDIAPSDKAIQATTRSVFGWKNTYIIRPMVDTIEPYNGARPFANFVVHGVPLYVHAHLLDETLLKTLLPHSQKIEEAASESTDREGLPKKNDKDDDFW
jgi:hypothetical protein